MARRASGEIYQVDLIAALFGGFMISWLVSAQETDFQVYSRPLKFATIEMRVVGDHLGLGSKIWYNALPLSVVSETGCIGSELAEDLIGGVPRFISCSSEAAEKLNTIVSSPAYALNYWNNFVDACAAGSVGSPFPRTQSYYSNWALDASLPSFLSPIGTVHRKYDLTKMAVASAKPIFSLNKIFLGNCGVRIDDQLASQLFLVSNFDQQTIKSVPLPISSGNGAILLTGTLSGASAGTAPVRRILFSDSIQLVDSNDEIAESGAGKMSNLRVQALLCVFSEGTETCYGGEQPLTNAGATALTLTKSLEPW